MLSQITAAECRGYVKHRGKVGGARADLETLRAAINHHAKENLHYGRRPDHIAGQRATTRSLAYTQRGREADMGMLALSRAANRSSRSPQGTVDSNRQAASPTPGQVYPDWTLYRHARRCDRLGVTVPPRFTRSSICTRHLLSAGHRPPRDQQAADARAGTPRLLSPYAALGSARHRHFALRGMAGGAGQIGQDRLQARGQTCGSLGQGNTARRCGTRRLRG